MAPSGSGGLLSSLLGGTGASTSGPNSANTNHCHNLNTVEMATTSQGGGGSGGFSNFNPNPNNTSESTSAAVGPGPNLNANALSGSSGSAAGNSESWFSRAREGISGSLPSYFQNQSDSGGNTSNNFNSSSRNFAQNLRGNLQNAGERLGLVESEPDPCGLDELCPSLSYKQRIMGWLVCFLLGTLISILASHEFRINPSHFARLYTLGTLVSFTGSFFLSGPAAQLRGMFALHRRLTTLVMFSLIVGTVALSIYMDMPDPNDPANDKDGHGGHTRGQNSVGLRLLVLLLVLGQWIAVGWYSLSYIPYAQDTVISCVKRGVGCCWRE